ncbi:MAG: hypothetical protein WDZ84_05005 [Rhodovibrionaceae bacterium]
MTTPNDKIRAGLDARNQAKSAGSFDLASLQGAPASIADLQKLAAKATAKRDRLKVLSESIVSAIEQHTQKKKAEFAELGKTREGNLIRDELGDNRRRTMLDREVSRFSREARKISSEERVKLVQELRDISSKLEATKAGFTDPVGLLSRRTLADPKRATYSANLASAGPVAVEDALRTAVLTGDASLAAASLNRLDAMSKDSRKLVRFSKKDVAESLVAEELGKATEFITMTEIAAAEGELANGEAEGKRTTANQKIGLGIMKSKLPKTAEAEDDPEKKTLSAETWEKQLDAKFPGRPVPDNVTVIGRGDA